MSTMACSYASQREKPTTNDIVGPNMEQQKIPCEPLAKSKHVEPLFKTKMCAFHIEGRCSRGVQCMFAHDAAELQPLPDLSFTKICPRLLQHKVCEVRGCKYAHDASQLKSTMQQTAEQSSYEEETWQVSVKNTFLTAVVSPPKMRRCCSAPPSCMA